MNSTEILDQIRIASPCKASWDGMTGDDRVRFCGLCRKHVYNISAMTSSEAAALVKENEGGLCVRLYRRADGTVLAADCPVGVRAAVRRRARRVAACAAIVVAGLFSSAASLRALHLKAREPFEPPPMGPGVTLNDWVDWVLTTIGLRQRVVMGRICPTPPGQTESADSF
jgi:hypothetical protein